MDFVRRGAAPDTNANISPKDVRQNERWHQLRFIRDARWSRRQKLQLLSHLSHASEIYQNRSAKLDKFCDGRRAGRNEGDNTEVLAQDWGFLQQSDCELIFWGDERYPQALYEIADPPVALFANGDLSLLQRPSLAVVGSRRPTPAGSQLTKEIVSQLAQLGWVITSGMALGVDGLAHEAALNVGGATVAVMGCGLDIVYPQRHNKLHQRISQKGLLLSEFPLGVAPSKATFPQRNRIVSGLSRGALIIEAAERSGTLITARLAMEQNREVLVVPGSALSAQYRGSNALIRQGAALISSAQDVLEELGGLSTISLGSAAINNPTGLDSEQRELLRHIDFESTAVDSVIQDSGLTAAKVSSMLLLLELEGVIALADDGGYVRLR